MPEINAKTLVMAIQAVNAKNRRLRALPEDVAVPGNDVLLVDFEDAAGCLEDAHAEATPAVANVTRYSQLGRH